MTQPMNPDPGPEPDPTGSPSRRTPILIAVAVVLAVIVVIGIVLVATSGDDSPASTASSSSSEVVTKTVTETPSTTEAPDTTDETTTTEDTPTDETTTTTSATPANNPGGMVIYECGGQASVRPTDITSIYCGDNSVSVTDVTWSRWGPRTAVGTGTESINSCRPNCAAGNYQQRPVRVELAGARQKAFTTIKLTGEDGIVSTYQLTGAPRN